MCNAANLGTPAQGGGVYILGATLEISGATARIMGNTAASGGGGVHRVTDSGIAGVYIDNGNNPFDDAIGAAANVPTNIIPAP